MSGFAVLTLSEFIPLVFFGALVSVAMAVGLLGNIVLLPIMLRWLPETAAQRQRQIADTEPGQRETEEHTSA
jgi:predicted RND superfamily exporter protein